MRDRVEDPKIRNLIAQFGSLSGLQQTGCITLVAIPALLAIPALAHHPDRLNLYTDVTLLLEGFGISAVCFRGFLSQKSKISVVAAKVFLARFIVILGIAVYGGWGWYANYYSNTSPGWLMSIITPLTVLLPALTYGLSKSSSWNATTKWFRKDSPTAS